MRKINTRILPSKRFLQFAMETQSWHPVERNGWIIKFSVYKGQFVLLAIISQHTGQLIMRHFTNEDDACLFINSIVELSADEHYLL